MASFGREISSLPSGASLFFGAWDPMAIHSSFRRYRIPSLAAECLDREIWGKKDPAVRPFVRRSDRSQNEPTCVQAKGEPRASRSRVFIPRCRRSDGLVTEFLTPFLRVWSVKSLVFLIN